MQHQTALLSKKGLKKKANIPVFHDDEHGTAIVTVAGLVNALKLVGKSISEIKVVANGAGAAGIAIIKCFYTVMEFVTLFYVIQRMLFMKGVQMV